MAGKKSIELAKFFPQFFKLQFTEKELLEEARKILSNIEARSRMASSVVTKNQVEEIRALLELINKQQ